MSSTKAIASSTAWQLGSQAAMAVLSIVATKFVAIGLSKELAGYYNSAYGFLQIFAIVADFGLYAVSVREVSRASDEKKGDVLGALLVLRSIILVLSMGAALMIAWAVPAWQGTPLPMAVTIAALVPFFTLLAGVLRTVFQIKYKMHFVFVAEVLQRVLTTAGIGYFIYMGARLTTDVNILDWFLWIGGIGAFLLFLISFIYAEKLIRVRPNFDSSTLKKLFWLAAPFGIAYLLMAMYRQLDVIFIALLRADFAVQNAYYGFAGRVEDMAFLIPTFLLNSTLPILTERLEKKEDVKSLLSKTFFILLLSGTVFLLFSYFWAAPFTLMFATPHYLSDATHAGSDVAFRLMSVPMFFNGFILFSFYVFLAQHAWRRLIATLSIGVVLTVVLNILLTPSLGFVGAGLASVVTHVLLTIILLPQTLRVSPITFQGKELLQWSVFTVVTGGILYLSAAYLTSALKTVVAGAVMIPVLGTLAFALGIHKQMRG